MSKTKFDAADKRYQLLMDILLEAICRKETITYKGVEEICEKKDEELAKRMDHRSQIPKLLGDLNYKIFTMDSKVPTISSLVFSKKTGVPGNGIDDFSGFEDWEKLDDNQKRERAAKVQEEVFSYPYWSDIYQTLFGHPPPSVEDTREYPEQDGNIAPSIRGAGGESEEHRRLKEYVAQHPEKLEIKAGKSGEMEYLLPSADKVDVFFHGSKSTLVEVKSCKSSDDDLKRGIYQCVKYRAVYSAWRLNQLDVSNNSFVQAVLVTERDLPKELAQLTSELKIEHFTITPPN